MELIITVVFVVAFLAVVVSLMYEPRKKDPIEKEPLAPYKIESPVGVQEPIVPEPLPEPVTTTKKPRKPLAAKVTKVEATEPVVKSTRRGRPPKAK